MNLKNLLFFALLTTTSSLSYASYTHSVSGAFPELDTMQQDYPSHIAACKQWIEAGTSERDGKVYPHQATFKKTEENFEQDRPYTKVKATRFLRDGEEKVDLNSHDIILSHLIQTSCEEPDQKGYQYSSGVVYRPVHQQVSYKLPAIDGVEGLEHELNYIKNNYISTQEVEKAASKFIMIPDETKPINDCYYRSCFLQKKPNSYIYNVDQNFFVMQYQSETLEPVNHPDLKAYVNFLFETPHKIILKPGTQTSNLNGFDWKGIYILNSQQAHQWQKVKTDLSIDAQESYTLTHPEGHCFQTIEFDPNVSNTQMLEDLRLSSMSRLIESLDFKGRVFEPAEQQELITLLTAMPQLKSLNLTKAETTKDYNTLIPTLVTLTNLKSLNLTNGQITEENRQKLTALAGLELLPAAQPVEPVPANPEEQPQDPVATPVPDPQALGTGNQDTAPSEIQTSNPEGNPPTTEGQSSVDPTGQLASNPRDQSSSADSTTQQIQALEANPESPSTNPIVAPKENTEPNFNSTPTVNQENIQPVEEVTKEITSPTQAPAVTLTAGTTEAAQAAQAASDPSTAPATPTDAATTDATPPATDAVPDAAAQPPAPAADAAPDVANPLAALLGQAAQPQ